MANNPVSPQTNRFINQVCSNTKTDFIEITEDKLENILIKFLKDFKNANNWLLPFSIFLSILITVLTATFNDFLTISKEIWCSIFYLGLMSSAIWCIKNVTFAIKNRKKIRIDYLIRKIKNN